MRLPSIKMRLPSISLLFLFLFATVNFHSGEARSNKVLSASSERRSTKARNLQDSAEGFFRNMVGAVNMSSFEENIATVEVIYTVRITGGTLERLTFNIFRPEFGTPNSSSLKTFVDEEEVEPDSISLDDDDFEVTMDIDSEEEGLVFRATFEVEGIVCQRGNTQAIPGTWLGQLDTIDTQNAELDFTIPLGEPLDDPFEVDFTPSASSSIENEENGFLTVFVTYSADTLGFEEDAEDVENMFFFLNANPFEEVNDCPATEDSNLFLIVVLAIPAIACCCLLGLAAIQRYVDSTTDVRTRPRLQNLFPGNPDIILTPNGASDETTVRAVLEEEDPQEFDRAVPINTINVNVETQQDVGRRSSLENRI